MFASARTIPLMVAGTGGGFPELEFRKKHVQSRKGVPLQRPGLVLLCGMGVLSVLG
jgi:hypothetical protein